MSSDTGAREPQPNAEALARRIKIALDYGLQAWRSTPTRVHFQTANDALNELLALAAGVGVPPQAGESLLAQSAENADVRGRAQRVINQAMESSGPPAAGTPERVLWDTAVGLARDVIALTDKVYDRGSDALVNDVEPEGAAAGDSPSREDARSLHASGDRGLAARPGSLARREIFPPDSAVDAPAGVGEARPQQSVEMPVAMENASVYWRKGEARPAEPPHDEWCWIACPHDVPPSREPGQPQTDDEHQRQIWESRCPELLAECERLREQLDAAEANLARAEQSKLALADMCHVQRHRSSALTVALERIVSNAESWHGPPPDDSGHVRALAVIANWARAALGVVGPPPDEVGALGQTASETRGGDS